MGKQRTFRRTGFLEKHTDSEGKKPKYEILIGLVGSEMCIRDRYNKVTGKKFVISTKNIIVGVEIL